MSRKKIIGHILIIVGILIPLQAFTHISYREMTSSSGYEEYKRQYIEHKKNSTKSENTIEDGVDAYNSSIVDGSGVVDPFVADDYKSSYNIEGWDQDKIFAYLIIPAINVKKPIRLDASYDHLDKGVAHVYGTSLPTGGVNRRSVIAGHRGWYRDIMFLNLGKLRAGDSVYIDREGKTLEYKVKDTEIISPSQWQKLKPIDGKDMLTLLSCHPIRPPSPYRLLVNCERVEKREVGSQVSSKASKKYGIRDVKIDESQKRSTPMSYLFYIVTILGWILLVFSVWRLVLAVKNYRHKK